MHPTTIDLEDNFVKIFMRELDFLIKGVRISGPKVKAEEEQSHHSVTQSFAKKIIWTYFTALIILTKS